MAIRGEMVTTEMWVAENQVPARLHPIPSSFQ